MKRTTLWIAAIFLAGLFTSGMALGMSHEQGEKEKEKEGSSVEFQHPDLTETEKSQTGVDATDPLAYQQLNEEQILELESILQDEGYEVGEIDGEIDLETREAIREFQRSEGLAITGQPNEETLRALSTDAEQQEFFGLSPEFGEEDQGVLEDREQIEERELLEERETLEQREETPRAID